MKPILFNTEMVRAILDGRKTVMREYIKHKICVYEENGKTYVNDNRYMFDFNLNAYIDSHAKYKKGDILYVKETFMEHHTFVIETTLPNPNILYKADYNELDAGMMACGIDQWKPPIHMPKEAARIFLRVTGVRFERLQDIRYHEVYREGIKSVDVCNSKCHSTLPCAIKQAGGECYVINAFKNLHNSTVEKSELDKYGWDANPWVWVYEFEVISKEEAMKENK